jgi:hypothetical protein
MDIDSLWQLKDARAPPQWHLPFTSSTSPPTKALVLANRKKNSFTRGNGDEDEDDSGDSMPGLMEYSNSSEGGNIDYSDDSDDDSDDNSDGDEDEGEESEYDAEHEDDIRDMLREAMDIAHEADFFGSIGLDTGPGLGLGDGTGSRADERKGNPFLKLLGSLRGEH